MFMYVMTEHFRTSISLRLFLDGTVSPLLQQQLLQLLCSRLVNT